MSLYRRVFFRLAHWSPDVTDAQPLRKLGELLEPLEEPDGVGD